MLTVSHLYYRHTRFGRDILTDINLSLEQGETLCILGPNGSGKTTLLRCLIGSLAPTQGSIHILGQSQMPVRQRARLVAYVPQASHQSQLTLLDCVLMGRAAYRPYLSQPSQADQHMAYQALARFAIDHLAKNPFSQLSGGERQLGLIARALVQTPKLLVMDEPTSNLDLGNQARVLHAILGLKKEGISVLVTTHQPDHALLLEAQVALLAQGQLQARGAAHALLNDDSLSALYGTKLKILHDNNKPLACVPCV